MSGDFTISGGSFTAPNAADKFYVGGTWTNNGGTFNNGGTSSEVTLDGASKNIAGTATTTFNDLTIDGSYLATTSVTVTDVLIIDSDDSGTDSLTLDATSNAVTLSVETSITIGNNGDLINDNGNDSDRHLTLIGTNVGTPLSITKAPEFRLTTYLQNVDIQTTTVLDTNVSLIYLNDSNCNFAGFTVSTGVAIAGLFMQGYDVSFTGDISIAGTISGIQNNGGNINAGTNSITLNGNDTTATISLDGNGILTAGAVNVTSGKFDLDSSTCSVDFSGNLTIGASGTVEATGFSPDINVAGNWDNNGTFTAGSSKVILDGTTSTTFEAGSSSYYQIEINKTGTDSNDEVTVQTDTLTMTNALTVTNGVLDQDIAISGPTGVTIAAGGEWINDTNSDVTLAGDVANAGIVTFNGITVNNGITIASSDTTKRNWQTSGAGSFSFTDVTASYQSCTGGSPATIAVTSGTSGGNNLNWTFGTNTVTGAVYKGVTLQTSDPIGVVFHDVSAGTTDIILDNTNGSGIFGTTVGTIGAGDIIGLYTDDDNAETGCTVIECESGGDQAGLTMAYYYVFLSSSNLTNADLNEVDADIDDEMNFTVDGSGHLTTGTSSQLMLQLSANTNYVPGGNVTVPGSVGDDGDITLGALAIMNMEGNDLNMTGTLNVQGTFLQTVGGTTTISGATEAIVASSNFVSATFYDLDITGTYSLDDGDINAIMVLNDLTVGDGASLTLGGTAGPLTVTVDNSIIYAEGCSVSGEYDEGIIISNDDNAVTLVGNTGDETFVGTGGGSAEIFYVANNKMIYLSGLDVQMPTIIEGSNGGSLASAVSAITLSGACTFDAITIQNGLWNLTRFYTGANVCTVGGTITVDGNGTTGGAFHVDNGGTLTATGQDIVVNLGGSGFWVNGNGTATFDDMTSSGWTGFASTPTGSMNITGNYTNTGTVNFGSGACAISLEGNWNNSGGVISNAGSSTITLDGSTASTTFIAKSDGSDVYNNITINKTDGDDGDDNVTFQTNAFTIDGTLTVTDGEAVQQVPFTRVDAVDLANAGKWTNTTAGADITLGGNVTGYGSGHLNFDAAFNIRSSAATQRNWDGGLTADAMSNVDVSYQNWITDRIKVTSGTDSGNNTNWVFGENQIFGTVYTDDTKVSTQNSTAVTVVVYDNSAGTQSIYTTTTHASDGTYSVGNGTLAENDLIGVYLDTGGATKATSVYKCAGPGDVTGLDLYVGDLVISGGSITTTNLSNADDTDTDILYSIDGDDDFTLNSGVNLYIESGATLNLESNNIDDISGNMTIESIGTLTQAGGTTILSGTSKTITGAGTYTFYNLTIDGTYTFQPSASVTMTVSGTLLTNDSGDTLSLDADTGNIDLVLEARAYVNNGNIEIISSDDDTVTIQGTDDTVRDFGEDSGDNFIDLNGRGVYVRYLDFKMNAVADESGDNIKVTGPCTFVDVSLLNVWTGFQVFEGATATINGNVTTASTSWLLVGDNLDTDTIGIMNVSGDINIGASGWLGSGLAVAYGDSIITATNIDVSSGSIIVVDEDSTTGKIDVSGNITMSGGSVKLTNYGTIELEGNWDNSGTTSFISGTSSTITLDGSAAGSTFTAKAGDTYNNITVNKTSGTDALDNVTFQTNAFTIDGILTVTDGEVVQQVPFTRVDAVDLANAGKWTNTTASADITLGGNVIGYGSGHLNFDAAFNIRSSETTQRNWDGGFTVDTMSNVDVSYQNCTTGTIAVTSGTDSGNNINWAFGGSSSISGIIIESDLVNDAGADKTVNVVVYDASTISRTTYTDETNSSGIYLVTDVTLEDGDVIGVYVDEEDENCTTVYKCSDGSDVTGLNLYDTWVTVNSSVEPENFGKVDDSDDEILYSVDASDNLTIDSGVNLFVIGTLALGAKDLNLSGNLRVFSAGAITQTTGGTTTLSGSGKTIDYAGTYTFNNLTIDGIGGASYTIGDSTDDMTVECDGILTVADDDTLAFTDAGAAVTLQVETEIVNNNVISVTSGGSTNKVTIEGTGSLTPVTGTFFDLNGKHLYIKNLEVQVAVDLDTSQETLLVSGSCQFNEDITISNVAAITAISGATITTDTADMIITAGQLGYINAGFSGETGFIVVVGDIDHNGDMGGLARAGVHVFDNGSLTVNNIDIATSASVMLNDDSTFTVTGNIVNNGTIYAEMSGETTYNASINCGGNFDNSSSVAFHSGNSTVTFNGTGTQAITSGGDAFNDVVVTNSSDVVTFADALVCVDFTAATDSIELTFAEEFTCTNFAVTGASSELIFNASDTYTITGNTSALDLNGQAAGTKISLNSDVDGSAYTFDVTNAQTVLYVDVKDSVTETSSITASNSNNSGGNDDLLDAPHWVFGDSATITSPAASAVIGQNPVVMGTSTTVAATVEIWGDVLSVSTKIGEGTADSNGNFIISCSLANLDTGVNTLVPKIGTNSGPSVSVTASLTPGTAVPTITTPDGSVSISSNPFTVAGTAANSTNVKLQALDANGDWIMALGTGTSDGSGSYSLSADAVANNLAVSDCQITVTTYDSSGDPIATSAITTIDFVDPFGIVFDSVTNSPIQGASVTLYYAGSIATVGGQLAATDTNPQVTGADGSFSFNVVHPPDASLNLVVSASGYTYPSTVVDADLPAGRVIRNPSSTPPGGSKAEAWTFTGALTELDLPMDPNATLLKIEKTANKNEVTVGDIITYTVTINNSTLDDVITVYLEDKIPAGFKYLSGKAILDGSSIAEPTGTRPIMFNIGTVTAGETRTLKYQLIVGSGVSFGKYANSAFAKYLSGTVISNIASEEVKIVPDPLFDLSTVIGKVFWDKNENGLQDKGESPIPKVRIVTEDGTVIITDKDGKYHLPATIPGRHVFRLDESTLPESTYLTTPKAVIVDVRQGLSSKVNFGVNSNDDLSLVGKISGVSIIQEKQKPQARLNVALYNDTLEVRNVGGLKEAATFKIFTNYVLFINKWKLEILDKHTRGLFKRFIGGRRTLTRPIVWNGTSDRGGLVKSNRKYAYVLTVWDRKGKFDKTKLREFNVKRFDASAAENKKRLEEGVFGKEKTRKNMQEFWSSESRVNNLDLQNINLNGEVIKVFSSHSPVSSIKIIQAGKMVGEIGVVSEAVTAKEDLTRPQFKPEQEEQPVDIIVPSGEYQIQVISTDPQILSLPKSTEGVTQTTSNEKQTTFSKDIKVGDDYFFFVGMSDAEMGYNFESGNTEPVGDNDRFKKGFWVDGKLAYYLKAKIKGKYLITSSLDTQRDQKELFKYIDPDKYYPVYGDSSSVSYEASDTQGMFYALVQWDRSSAMWGNYNVGFTDTEFAQFSRTLFGAKAELISTSDTKFGEPNTKIITFMAKAKQKAAHNEFVGTGGSLYYLKHKHIVEGSDKIKLNVLDKITGLILTTIEQKEGSDYQIDYDNGRIIFWKPISQIAEADSIISSNLLDGNKLYVVADYEYYTQNKYDEWSKGARLSQQIGDYVRFGGTYVQDENQAKENYELKGIDTTFRLGDDIKFDVEYAETKSEEGNNFISTDGGITFTELSTDETAMGSAYGLKGEARLFDKLALTGYYKKAEKGFSLPSNIANQGTEKIGAQLDFDISAGTRLSARHDIQELLDDGNLESRTQIGADKTETTTVQLDSQLSDKLKATAEYRRQRVSGEIDEYDSQTNEDADIVALKLARKLTDKTTVSAKYQESLSGEENRQGGLGVETKLTEHVGVRAEGILGSEGSAATAGVTANIKDKFDIFGDYTLSNEQDDGFGNTITAGGKAQVDDKTSVYNTYSVTDSEKGKKTEAIVFGTKKKLEDGYEVSMAREFSKEGEKFASANSFGIAKHLGERKIEGTFKEEAANEEGNVSHSNIFGLSGDINDKWAASLDFEKGKVQNLDGTKTKRIAVSGATTYVDKDKIKASSKLEFRHDDSSEDSQQILVYNAVEGKMTEDLTLFAKANLSFTENTSTDITTANFKEMVLGAAYRPVYHDRLNLISKYTFLEDESPSSQDDFEDIEHIKAHVFGLEVIYDLNDKLQLVEKGAVKYQDEKVSGFDFTDSQTRLLVNRLNYNLDEDWQIGAEYRMLDVVQAEDLKQGALLEVSRRLGEFLKVGAGYNFTDFTDDLTDLDYTVQGPFVRMTGVLYDRTPQEIKLAKERELERKIEEWTWKIINTKLACSDSELMRELYKYFQLAEIAYSEMRLEDARQLYTEIQDKAGKMYAEANHYIRKRVEIENRIKDYDSLAQIYYKEGRLLEARELWQKILVEAKYGF
ncbi:MAG: hypothetical protein P9L96_06890 [Candidatus Gygaella obscura]|nr:hypothetical protein [Candidatus Gygaella obscura]